MRYNFFSHNGKLLPADQALVPLAGIEYAYGFGVYESVRFSKGKFYFLAEHCDRLLQSAKQIELEHDFTSEFVVKSVKELVEKNQVEACNIKIMLIGGENPDLYVICLNPLFPRRESYKNGVLCTTFEYERDFPAAKTLNMLPSYLAYRQAKSAGAYEALLINRRGCITEGTRSNFFVVKDRAIIGPPGTDILPGITRAKVLDVASEQGFVVTEEPIPLTSVDQYDGAFLTSTSAKIMPVRQIGEKIIGPPPPGLKRLMVAFDEFLATI